MFKIISSPELIINTLSNYKVPYKYKDLPIINLCNLYNSDYVLLFKDISKKKIITLYAYLIRTMCYR
jgi:hypothetical protein